MKILYAFAFFTLVFIPYAHAKTLQVEYGLYAGGFNIANLDAVYTLNESNYAVEADLRTTGLLGTLAPWSGMIETNGLNGDDRLIPQNHFFENTWRGDTKSTRFTFDQDGQLLTHEKERKGRETDASLPPSDVYADNPVDMLTALMAAMQGETCATTQKVFDSKRRFNLVFRKIENDMMEANKYNRYNGMAEICEVEIVPVAGKWRDKPRGWMNIQGQAKEKGQLPRLWFGQVEEGFPAIPVRMTIKTNYGTMLMHLQDVK